MYAGIDRVCVENDIDWREEGNDEEGAPLLRVAFSTNLRAPRATYEVPFAGLGRSADGREVPALRWADLSDGAYGLSILNDGKYGHSAEGATLRLTLLRASYSPDPRPDVGEHRFTYALYPHAGDWRRAGTVRAAAGLNQPLVAVVEPAHGGAVRPRRPVLATVSPAGVTVSAVKPAAEAPGAGRVIVLRLFESQGRRAKARITPAVPVSGACRSDVLERPGEELVSVRGAYELPLRPHEIATVRLTLAPPCTSA